jgi:hypothetical protein
LKSELFENQIDPSRAPTPGFYAEVLAKRMVPQPAAISTSGGRLVAFTRRLVLAICASTAARNFACDVAFQQPLQADRIRRPQQYRLHPLLRLDRRTPDR